MIAEIQDSLANSDKPLMRAFIELCKALNVGGRKKDQAQSAFAKALHDVIREAATARIESSNAASPSNAAPALSALAQADVESSNAASPSNAAPALSALAPADVESSNAASPSNAAPARSALERVCPERPELDIWIVPEFAQTMLNVDPKELQDQLEQNYPVRRKDDPIEWAEPQWVEGDNEALHYRGHDLKRGKMWCQAGDPKTEGFVKYYYTGWQYAVLPATCDVQRVPELAEVVENYNTWVTGKDYPAANHFIFTHYVDGDHNIGMHFDKPVSIAEKSLITIVKTGEYGRPFRIEMLDDGTVLMDKVLAPGTAVIMTLEANLKTKHGVPAVAQAGSSGSIVFRTIKERVGWADLERQLSKTATSKKRKADSMLG